jgi:hypothetical protein
VEREHEQKLKHDAIDRKKIYFQDLHKQYIERQRFIEDEINRNKNEQLAILQKNKENEEIKQYMLERMKKKYYEILDYNKYVLLYNDDFNIWKNKRKQNITLRYDLFNTMFDIETIQFAYNDYNEDSSKNYHFGPSIINENILDNLIMPDDSSIIIPETQSLNISLYDKLDRLTFEDHSSNNNSNLMALDQSPGAKQPLPRFYLKNFIINEIIEPMIGSVVKTKKIVNVPQTFALPKEISTDIFEVVNQMQALLVERNNKEDILIEIPINVFIEELFNDIIIKQYKIVNTTFVHMIKYKYHILEVFNFVKNVFLAGGSDILNTIIEHYIDFNSKIFEIIF